MDVLSKDELAPKKFENCLLAPMKFGDLLTVAPANFLTYLASYVKAKLQKEGIFFHIHLFARDILLMKKLEIEETKTP